MGLPESSMPSAQVCSTKGSPSKNCPFVRIQDVEESIAIALHQQFSGPAPEHFVDQQQRLLRVPVVGVVRRELEVPLEHSRLRCQRHHRVRVEVVSSPPLAIQVGTGVARRPVEQIQLGVIAARQPGRPTPSSQDVRVAPGFRPRLTRLGDRPEAPCVFARGGVIGVEESAESGIPRH